MDRKCGQGLNDLYVAKIYGNPVIEAGSADAKISHILMKGDSCIHRYDSICNIEIPALASFLKLGRNK